MRRWKALLIARRERTIGETKWRVGAEQLQIVCEVKPA
jgi:hypothetical protein